MQSTNPDLYETTTSPTDRQTNMMMEFMLQNYTDPNSEGTYNMSFTSPFRRLFATGEGATTKEGDVRGVRSTLSSKVPLRHNAPILEGEGYNVNQAIELAKPVLQERHGTHVKYNDGDKVKKPWWKFGGGKNKEEETETTHGLSDEVVKNYHDYYGEQGINSQTIDQALNDLNPTSQDTVFFNQSTHLPNVIGGSDHKVHNMIHEFVTDGKGGKTLITPNVEGLFGIPTEVEEEGEKFMYPSFPSNVYSSDTDNPVYTEAMMSSKIPLKSNWELMQNAPEWEDGGIVDYLKKERSINRNNNRILAEQRISDFQRFMKNRK